MREGDIDNMRVVVDGRDRVFETECDVCHSILVYKLEDLKVVVDKMSTLITTTRFIICPICGNRIIRETKSSFEV